jgi:hypothetical protein
MARALVWLGLAVVAQRVGASCRKNGARCQCTDSDGDIWDLTELSGNHQVTGPGSSIWTFECERVPGPDASPPRKSLSPLVALCASRPASYGRFAAANALLL